VLSQADMRYIQIHLIRVL